MNTLGDDLLGLRVLICRPERQARGLQSCLQELGAEVDLLPCLEVVPVVQSQLVKEQFVDLDRFQKVIFISQNAAKYGLDWIDQYWPQLPEGIDWYAIGGKTAAVLAKQLTAFGIAIRQPFNAADSEALLELASLQQVAGQKILIVRGEGGREYLPQVLTTRGAQISFAEVYTRICPEYQQETLQRKLVDMNPILFICLSAETCENLHAIAKTVGFDLSRKYFIMPSKRAVNNCADLDLNNVLIPVSLAEAEIASCIRTWWQTNFPTEVGA